MRLFGLVILVALVGLAATTAAASLLYLDTPPVAHTGGFGEPSCAACHFDNPVDDGEGEVRVSGFPKKFEPGERYTLTVEVRRPNIALAGFQAAIRFSGGEMAGRQAGELLPLDDRVDIQTADSVSYVHHSVAGATLDDGVGRWQFEWIAPDRGARGVVLHAAGNAANDDDSVFGDYIYLAEVVSRLRR